MTATTRRLRRAMAALTLCLTPALATQAAAEPRLEVCLPGDATCVVAELDPGRVIATAETCTADGICTTGTARACLPPGCDSLRANAALCVVRACFEHDVEPLGGIEQPATGSITITESPGNGVTTVLTGVFDPATGDFVCTTSAAPGSERTVRCVPTNPGIDWYCAGWVLTASTHTNNSQVATQASCSDHHGFPGSSSNQTLWTAFAQGVDTETASAAGLAWFVDGAIVCQAWGYSAGPQPMGSYTATCNEPGANAPR